MSKYYPPQYEGKRFHCLHCQTYAHQDWEDLYSSEGFADNEDGYISVDGKKVKFSICASCYQPTFWAAEKIIYPLIGMFPPANED